MAASEPASFTILPPEIVDEIVQVDQRLHEICLPYIYGAVTLYKTGALVAFSDTLNSRPVISGLVKTLKIDCHQEVFARPHKRHVPPQFSENDNAVREACGAAIGGLMRLVSLEIIRPWSLLPLLPSGSFLLLRTLITKFSPHLPKFLKDHPHIESLSIELMTAKAQFHAQIPPIHLPALRAFTGPEAIARAVIADASVPALNIFWDPPPMRQTPAAATLARLALAATPITELHNDMDGWGTPDPRALARALPALTVLTYLNLRRDSSHEERAAFIAALTAALPDLHHLDTLALEDPALRARLALQHTSTLDDEWRLLHRWHSLCPTLRECTLLSGVCWVRAPTTLVLWVPGNAGRLARVGRFFEWFQETLMREETGKVLTTYASLLEKMFLAGMTGGIRLIWPFRW
ncbi:hypothetical protein FB451DRAFT_1391659 [Mycena latifolia]|nr:hypothetical protein FB451DRAFT_1391659 [Mycena latifolia]